MTRGVSRYRLHGGGRRWGAERRRERVALHMGGPAGLAELAGDLLQRRGVGHAGRDWGRWSVGGGASRPRRRLERRGRPRGGGPRGERRRRRRGCGAGG